MILGIVEHEGEDEFADVENLHKKDNKTKFTWFDEKVLPGVELVQFEQPLNVLAVGEQ